MKSVVISVPQRNYTSNSGETLSGNPKCYINRLFEGNLKKKKSNLLTFNYYFLNERRNCEENVTYFSVNSLYLVMITENIKMTKIIIQNGRLSSFPMFFLPFLLFPMFLNKLTTNS